MNNYRVGDRVWLCGDKFVVSSVGNHVFKNGEVNIYISCGDYDIYLYSNDPDLKPIIKIKNGVICENN